MKSMGLTEKTMTFLLFSGHTRSFIRNHQKTKALGKILEIAKLSSVVRPFDFRCIFGTLKV